PKTVRSAAGACVAYDLLLLATGSKPVALALAGLDRPGVCTFRDIADAEKMIAASDQHRRAIVIGGGLLGLEAAWGLKRRGIAVTVVHLMPNPDGASTRRHHRRAAATRFGSARHRIYAERSD